MVYLPGLSFSHAVPQGLGQVAEVAQIWPLAARFAVHWLGRRPGIPADYRIADHAQDVAEALRRRFDHPVPVVGFSTGGFIGLQLAIDNPAVVDRLVVIGAGHRLTQEGRDSDLRWADALEQGRNVDAWREVASDLVALAPLAGALNPVLAVVGRLATPPDCTDGIRTARAEAAFDAGESLHRIECPTLLITGALDRNVGSALAQSTRDAIPHAELLLLPRTGHVGSLVHPRAMARAVADLGR